jgi:glutaredoxin
MKKILILTIMAIIISMPLYGAVNVTNDEIINTNDSEKIKLTQDFTHTVLVESMSATTCPYCPAASDQLYSIYNSGDLDFIYVTIVADKMGELSPLASSRVYARYKELGVEGVPDVYFDGDFNHIVGRQEDEQPYRNAIENSGERTVPEIDIDLSVDWLGIGNSIRINAVINNNEPSGFNGIVRLYITEIDSRWTYSGSKQYHYAILDIPYDNTLALSRQGIKSKEKSLTQPVDSIHEFSKLWSGDISKDNCMVFLAIFDENSDKAVQAASAFPSVSNERSVKSFNSFLLNFLEKISNKFSFLN